MNDECPGNVYSINPKPVVMQKPLIYWSEYCKLMSFVHSNRGIDHSSQSKIHFKVFLHFPILFWPQVNNFRREMLINIKSVRGANVVVRETRRVTWNSMKVEGGINEGYSFSGIKSTPCFVTTS